MKRWHLLHARGIEIEYAIVSTDTFEPLPIADWLLSRAGGRVTNEAALGDITLSNELALHVIELKLPEPVSSFDGVAERFQRAARAVNELLAEQGAQLLPTGMHPLMVPRTEALLWPHGDAEIYREFHRLFDCARHGWTNLQSTHLNLSFDGDEEFARLHAAVRLVLPLIPGLAASSPVVEGVTDGSLCQRLHFYRTNSALAPSITGSVVPEPVYSEADYARRVFVPIRRDLERLGERRLLDPQWVNARGAIARFDRGSVEIRLFDTQEHPAADVAVVSAVADLVRAVVLERWVGHGVQCAWDTQRLDGILRASSREGGAAVVTDREYLELFGLRRRTTVAEIWNVVLAELMPADSTHRDPVQRIVNHGCLARRIQRRLGPDPRRSKVVEVYQDLAACLHEGRGFV
jgi:gamma-glutamyl:cysteine ligase YbdK (ATP-grasp superfamily)